MADVLGAIKIGGVTATEIKELVWVNTLANLAAGIGVMASAAFTASAVGLRLYHTMVQVGFSGAPATALMPTFVAAKCLTADTVTFTAYNAGATARSGSAAEPLFVVAWR